MKTSFGFVVLLGDGSRVIRVSIPRRLAYATLGSLGIAAATMAVMSAGFLVKKSQAVEVGQLRQKVSEQQTAIGTFVHRVAAVRGEIDDWKELHARMWQPFGPEKTPAAEPVGVGGPREADEAASGASGTDPAEAGSPARLGEQLDLLHDSITEEEPRLKDLEALMTKNAQIMAALPLRWPVRGPVNSEFGVRNNPWGTGAKEHHGGIDIGVPYGSRSRRPRPASCCSRVRAANTATASPSTTATRSDRSMGTCPRSW